MLAAEVDEEVATSASSGLPLVTPSIIPPQPSTAGSPAPAHVASDLAAASPPSIVEANDSQTLTNSAIPPASDSPATPEVREVQEATDISASGVHCEAAPGVPTQSHSEATIGEATPGGRNPLFERMGMPEESMTGLNIRARTAEVATKVSELPPVQRGVQAATATAGYVADKSRAVAESERVQQGVEFMKKKTAELSESERVQRGLEVAQNIKTSAQATAAVATVVAQEGINVAKEKAKEGVEYAKEKTQKLREGAGNVWERGRGTISRARANVSKISWRGSARETLDIEAREEQWKDIKVQGAEELTVPARTEHTTTYHVGKGSTLRWTFRVKEHDIGFGVRMRVQEWGGSREEEILGIERYDNADTISGSWVADENRTIVLVFDNRYSKLRGKTVAYYVGTEKPAAAYQTADTTPTTEASPAAAPVATASPAEAPLEAAPTVAASATSPVVEPPPVDTTAPPTAAAEQVAAPGSGTSPDSELPARRAIV